MSVYEEKEYFWLARMKGFILEAIPFDRTRIGICFRTKRIGEALRGQKRNALMADLLEVSYAEAVYLFRWQSRLRIGEITRYSFDKSPGRST